MNNSSVCATEGAVGLTTRRSVSAGRRLGREADLIDHFQKRGTAGAVKMQRYLLSARGMQTALLAGMIVLSLSAISFAGTPALGPDCGTTGAAIVGSDSAGKVTLGAGVTACTLTFSVPYPNAPACSATNETNGGGFSVAVGVKTTTTNLEVDSLYPWHVGDVVSYMCLDY
jgi:hypothetical protein